MDRGRKLGLQITEVMGHAARTRLAVTRLLARIETRKLEDGPTAEELALEADFTTAMVPGLENYYMGALLKGDGLGDMPRDTKENVRECVKRQFDEHPELAAVLVFLFIRYITEAMQLGGDMALEQLGAPGDLSVTIENPLIIELLQDHSEDLFKSSSPLNLVDKSVEDIVKVVWNAIQAGASKNSEIIQAARDRFPGITASRASLIVETELARALNAGLLWTYAYNGVQEVELRTRGDDRVCKICEPLNGVRYRINDIPAGRSLPLHPRCRCVWLAVLDGWTPPVSWWTGK